MSGSDVLRLFSADDGDEDENEGVRALSVRMPVGTYWLLESMASHADLSRNAMAVQLLRWGVSYALGQLPDEIRDEILGDAAEKGQ